jgi:hypothetical protein
VTATAEPALGLTAQPLWPHQAAAFQATRDTRAVLIDGDMGSGKTAAAIALLEHDLRDQQQRMALDLRQQPYRVLVLAPKSVLGVWPNQIAEHATSGWTTWNGEVRGRNGKPLRNPSVTRRAEALVQATSNAGKLRRPFMAVVGYEASWQGDMAKLLLGTPWDAVILDESHRISAPGGKTSRHAARIAERCRARGGRILALTGTPFPHSPLDIYAQARAIDPSVFGTSNAVFKARYAGRKHWLARGGEPIRILSPNDEAMWIVGQEQKGAILRYAVKGEPIYMVGPRLQPIYEGVDDRRMDDFTKRASRIIYRIPREGLDAYLGLPDAVDVYRTIDLDPATRRAYESLEKDLIARVGDGDQRCGRCGGDGVELDIEDGTTSRCVRCGGTGAQTSAVTAANAMVLVLRLAQVASGYAPTVHIDGQHDTARRLSDHLLPEKARLLLDVLEDLPLREPVVVFCRFHHDLDAVQAVCDIQGRSYGELSGRRRDGLTDHGTMADVDVLGAQIKSGGVGIDLTRARYGIYYTLGFELADYLQSRKRLHRPGQTRPVTYVHLLAENTVERSIYGALRNRQQVVDTVLQCLGGGTR